jgi:hypothetical protein
VKIFNPIERPSALPAVFAQVSGAPAVGLVGPGVLEVSQVHQVQAPAQKPAKAMVSTNGAYGTSGITVTGTSAAAKKRLDVRGVPPRGRPV